MEIALSPSVAEAISRGAVVEQLRGDAPRGWAKELYLISTKSWFVGHELGESVLMI